MTIPGPPPITPAMRKTARTQPNTWLYAVDPAFDPEGDVPGWAIVGAWRVDSRGEVQGAFIGNPDYRPSPQALNLPEPTNELERVLQLAATRRASDEELLHTVLETELLLFSSDEGGREIFMTSGASGKKLVQAFSSETCAPRSWTSWQRLRGRDLASALPDGELQINPGSPVSVIIPGEAICGALGGFGGG